jgi:hypothetical protein
MQSLDRLGGSNQFAVHARPDCGVHIAHGNRLDAVRTLTRINEVRVRPRDYGR